MTPEFGPFCNFRKLLYIRHKFALITKLAEPKSERPPDPPPSPRKRESLSLPAAIRPLPPASDHPGGCAWPPYAGGWPVAAPRSPESGENGEREREMRANFKSRFRARFFEPRAVPPVKLKLSTSTTSLGSQIFRSAADCTQNEAESVGEQ